MGTVGLFGMSTTVMGAEAVVVVVIVVLLVSILVMSRRRKRPAEPTAAAPPANYYTGLEQKQGGQPDPFASLTASPHLTGPSGQSGTPNGQGPNGQGPHGATNGQGPGEQTPVAVPAHAAAASASAPAPSATPPPQAAPPPPPAPAIIPPAGTPAGWLPDPSGAPDTLRYWDGNAWTPHFAQRA